MGEFHLTSEKIKGRMIAKLATSAFLTPALMKNAMETAHILTRMRIKTKMKNLSASTWKPVVYVRFHSLLV